MQAIPIVHQPEPQAIPAGSSLGGYPTAVLCWLLSAGVYIAAKWVAPEMPPWGLCFWRLLLACAILLPIVHRHHGAMLALLKSRPLEIVAVGAIGLTLCQGMIYRGLNDTDATTAGIDALVKLRFNIGELWIVGSAFCWALYTVLLRRSKFGLELLPLVVLLLGAGALVALPFHLWEIFNDERSALNGNGLLALAYLAGPGGALMYYLYNKSVETLGASRASMLLYLQTLFVAILAYLLLGESLHNYDLFGAAFIVLGIVLATVIKPRAVPAKS
jgi:drug/metabolite transporter (DMT)-like permease